MPALVCPSCAYENEANSKFCQECGRKLNPVVDKVEPAEIPPPPTRGITVEFGKSSSQVFEDALQTARKHNSFQELVAGKRTVYRVNVAGSESLAEIAELLRLISGWKSRKVFVDGSPQTWSTVFAFSWCFEQRQAAYDPTKYCFGLDQAYRFNVWGCTQLNQPFYGWGQWGRWGEFISPDGTWQFDRQRFRHELSTKLYSFRFCPALDLGLVEEVFNAMPERVNPNRDKGWDFLAESAPVPGCITAPRERETSFGVTLVTGPTYYVGVHPTGSEPLRQISTRLKTKRIPIAEPV